VAATLGIDAPATIACASMAELERALPALTFPAIVKPRFAYQWRRAGLWERIGGQKAFIVANADELRALYTRLAELASEVLIQEYVPGDDADIVVCCCCVGVDARLLGYFTGRKLRQNPPLIGTGSVVEAMPVPALIEPSTTLLGAFGYTGIAEIEFKHDRARDRYMLIEINPRHWDQHELGRLVGVNITWLAYADRVGLRPAPCTPEYRAGERYKWIAEGELARGVARNVWHALRRAEPGGEGRIVRLRRALADAAELVTGRRILATARLSDPVPGILTMLQTVRDLGRALGGRARR
jgi:D-aspartate ligase